MSIKHIFYFVFTFVSCQYGIKTVLGIENQQSCSFEMHKILPKNGVQNIELKVQTNIKQEILNLKQDLLDLMTKELTQQRTELQKLTDNFKIEKEELSNIKKEIIKQKEEIRDLIKSELLLQFTTFRDKIKIDLESHCGQKIDKQTYALSEGLKNAMTSQEKYRKSLFQNTVQAIGFQQSVCNRWDENFNCTKDCGPVMDLPSSCDEAMPTDLHKNGVYLLKIDNSTLRPFYAYCKRIDGKIWTVMQRREDGTVNFDRNWADYKHGFGDLYGEFWLGLQRLHEMTSRNKHELHVWLKNKDDKTGYAFYNQFSIANETEKFKLTFDGYKGNAGNSFSATDIGDHWGMKFSTRDNCNDNHSEGKDCCAATYAGGWWFNKCYMSNLNGRYNKTGGEGVDWNHFGKNLKYVQMAIRRA